MIQLRTFVFLDSLQPQLASFLATVSQGFLPTEGQASLFIEIAPGVEINRVVDVALKATDVRPGMLIVERDFGVLEVHAQDQGMVREAGAAILRDLGLKEGDRRPARVISSQVLTGVDAHQTMLLNRMRHGDMILKGETLFVLETEPAGYAMLAANEAEKAAEVKLMEVRAFGAFGRLYLAGTEAQIELAAKAARQALANLANAPGRSWTGSRLT